MEAIAAASSIAGIITVVGQSIDGLIKFSNFFSDISSASKIISRLLSDINSLIEVLENIGRVLEQARARRRHQNFASLDIKLEDCAKDVQVWLATARLLRPGSDSGGKAWLKKFRLAVNNTAIQTIREEIGRHKQSLCLSLEVFGRTIDIETSAQVHKIGGHFSEALTTSLSVHGAHEEALRRIEHYSMTSMHSSAHSIRSMDSIRTELSRLEEMITSNNNAQRPGSSHTERRFSAVVGEEDTSAHLSVHGPLLGRGGESSTARDSVVEPTSQQNPYNELQNGYNSSIQSQRTGEMAADNYRKSPDDPSNMDNRSMLKPAVQENKSSFLYAEFTKEIEPRRHQNPTTEIDTARIHRKLEESLASIYPPEVVKYITLQQHTILCETHLDLLDKRPTIQTSAIGKMKETNSVDSGTAASARASMISLRDRLIELRSAIKLSKEQCIQAGYSLSELDRLLSPPGSGSWAPADRPSLIDSGDDSSSLYSDDFHLAAE